MDPESESINWDAIDSVYVEDDKYESFNAPKWVDLSSPDEPVDEEAWFCKPACKHPKTVEDFLKSTRESKAKLLRSVSFSEMLPFTERNRRVLKEKEIKSRINPQELNLVHEESENNNPNLSRTASYRTHPEASKSNMEKKPLKNPKLKSTFSARNLLGGREIVSQITEFCTKLARKGSKKQSSCSSSSPERTEPRGILGELKERVRDRGRKPLLNKSR